MPCYRSDFPIFKHYHKKKEPFFYLNNAETTHKPQVVIDALSNFYSKYNVNVNRSVMPMAHMAITDYERARFTVQSLIKAASVDEIVWTSSTTESINLVANSWGGLNLLPGDEVLISQMEHHSNWLPWFQLCQSVGIVIKIIPVTESGALDIEEFYKLLNKKTKLIAVTHISNATGCVNPVKQMIKAAQTVNAVTLIDGAQAVAHIAVDVVDLDCDFYVFSAHKMYGPMGVGALYAKKCHLHRMKPWKTGGGIVTDISQNHEPTWKAIPFCFEAGTPNVASIIGWGAAIEYLQACDRTDIKKHEADLLQQLKCGLSSIPSLRVLSHDQDTLSIVSLQSKIINHYDLHQLLLDQGLWIRSGHHCAIPLMKALNCSGTIRFSFGLYNNKTDVDTCLDLLESISSEYEKMLKIASKPTDEIGSIPQLDSGFADYLTELSETKDWRVRYHLLMKLNQKMPMNSDFMKCNTHLIPDCDQLVWFKAQVKIEAGHPILRIWGDSQSQIMSSLIVILTYYFDKQPVSCVQARLFESLNQFKFLTDLTETRLSAWKYMLSQIKNAIK